MSLQSSIDIKLTGAINLVNMLRGLSSDLWKFDIDGSISYLPIQDKEYNWEYALKSDFEIILNIIETKFHNSESIGLSIYNLNINSGFLFHFFPDSNTIMLLISFYRIKIPETRFTDFSPYLIEILKIIPEDEITSITCIDTY